MDDRNGRPLHERVAALERTVTDGHTDEGLPDAARMDTRLDDLEATVEDLGDQVAELDAAVQALRGFAGGVRAVDEAVERRADAAVARVDRLETELAAVRAATSSRDGTPTVAESSDRTPAAEPDHDTHADSRFAPTRDGPSVGDERATSGDENGHRGRDGRGRDRDDSLNGDVAARTDAALADAAAMADDPDEDDDQSLADRIRRIL